MTHLLATALVASIALTLYCLPALLATFVRHKLVVTIWLINICLGWTVVGWAGALVRAWIPAQGSANSVAVLMSASRTGPPAIQGNLRGAAIAASLLAALGIAFSFAPPVPKLLPVKAAPVIVAGASMPVQGASAWNYGETRDPELQVTDQFADLESDNKLAFDFPYDGGTAKLTIRRQTDQDQKSKVEVYLNVDGRFNCAWQTGDTITITFDNDPPVKYACTITTQDTAGVLFIDNDDDAAAF